MTDLAELRQIAEAATQWAWESHAQMFMGGYVVRLRNDPSRHLVAQLYPSGNDAADALHIATFDPPTVLKLLDVVEAAEGWLKQSLRTHGRPDQGTPRAKVQDAIAALKALE